MVYNPLGIHPVMQQRKNWNACIVIVDSRIRGEQNSTSRHLLRRFDQKHLVFLLVIDLALVADEEQVWAQVSNFAPVAPTN